MKAIAPCLILLAGGTPLAAAPPCADRQPTNYCGVIAVARALRSYGRDVRFETLLKPEYISTRNGSTAEDLARAARDFGLDASVRRNANTFILQHLDAPAILHVRYDYESDSYDHWILYAGRKEDKALVYDSSGSPKQVEFADLAARWDGIGVFLAPRGQGTLWIDVAFAALVLAASGGVVAVVAAADRVSAVLAMHRFGGLRDGSVREAAVILGAAIVLLLAAKAIYPAGYLSAASAVRAIQDDSLATFLPRIDAKGVEAMLDRPDVVLIDARPEEDYARGHIGASLNIPYFWTAAKAEAVLHTIPRNVRLVIYCEGRGCYFSRYTARLVHKVGFRDLVVFEDGWRGWTRQTGG